jgi:ubiquinone/menaquinone biosynthesis C-methylase UbiE
MGNPERTLTRAEARAFYDRFGAGLDSQGFYEDAALDILVQHGDFENAAAVFELGCGTGRFAPRLLASYLPPTARYRGIDVSPTMVGLARERLRPWTGRAEVELSDGSLPPGDGLCDRFVSTYVLDLMSQQEIVDTLAAAYRLLEPRGLLCVVSLTHGRGPVGKLVSYGWSAVHRLRPMLVGGCRPIEILDFLPQDLWNVRHQEIACRWGITSEVVVAGKVCVA